jgi:hypothetical protein
MRSSNEHVVNPLPELSFMPRVWIDLDACIGFVARQPWGDPEEREREIHSAFEQIRQAPLARPISGWVPGTSIGLRRYYVRQFVVVYAYFSPAETGLRGLVSIRAVRHHRERDVLLGVREKSSSVPCPPLQTRDVSAETSRAR